MVKNTKEKLKEWIYKKSERERGRAAMFKAKLKKGKKLTQFQLKA